MMVFFFFNDTATTEIYTLSLHDALPISYTQGKREQFSGFNRTLDAINNVFRKFSAFHDETGRLNVDGMNIINGVERPVKEIGRAVQQECRDRSRMPSSA